MKMLISERIARLIEGMLADSGGSLSLQRNKLADEVGCVPSQINYVITSRFSTDRGYIVESKRGGGGFIKITKINFDKGSFLMHLLGAVGDSIDEHSARALLLALYENELLDEREYKFISILMGEKIFTEVPEKGARDGVRANMLKSLVLAIQNHNDI